MPPRRAGLALAVLLASWPGAPALAWNDATRSRMIHDALKVSPPALRIILDHHARDLGRGMLEPSRREAEEVHFQNADDHRGLAIDAALRKEDEIRALLAARRSFRRVTFEFGVLAHLVSDIAFPLNASDSDRREPLYREAYRAYVGDMLDKIPFVLDRSPLEPEAGLRPFLNDLALRAGRNYALIGPAFKDDGTPRSAEAVDERSVPFGIASLSYSNAVNAIVRVWMHLWASVDGDLQGTPFMNAPPPEPAKLPERAPRRRRPAPAASPTPAPVSTPAPSPTPAPAKPGAAPSPTPGGRK